MALLIALGGCGAGDGPAADFGIDAESGAVVWESDFGSPGSGGRFSSPGTFRFLDSKPPGQVLVGLIVAEEPHRD